MSGRRRLAAAGLLLLAVLLVSGAGLTAVRTLRQTAPQAPPPEPKPIISPDTFLTIPSTPTAAPFSSSHEGLRIKLPELGIDLPIVDGDGFNAPLYKAAHYPGLGWPGDGTRSVIYAHARTGMFGPLFNAKVGDEVDVADANGQARRYVIQEYYARWPITDLRWLQKANHEEVVLVTCTTYNYNDPRIVAVAEPA